MNAAISTVTATAISCIVRAIVRDEPPTEVALLLLGVKRGLLGLRLLH